MSKIMLISSVFSIHNLFSQVKTYFFSLVPVLIDLVKKNIIMLRRRDLRFCIGTTMVPLS